jgi:hypothetical protein
MTIMPPASPRITLVAAPLASSAARRGASQLPVEGSTNQHKKIIVGHNSGDDLFMLIVPKPDTNAMLPIECSILTCTCLLNHVSSDY